MIGSYVPCAIAIGGNGALGVELPALDLGDEAARTRRSLRAAGGRGRGRRRSSSPRPARSRRARSARAAASRRTRPPPRSPARTSRGRGSRPRRTTYQCAPPGGSESGARGQKPSRRRSGSSASSSGSRSYSSAPRPWKRTSAPSGSPAARPFLDAHACSSRGFGSGVRRRLELLAQRLELRRQREPLAEGLERLVGREARPPSVAISNSTPLGSRK